MLQTHSAGGPVLVVEDNEDLRRLIGDLLTEEGYGVVQAADGKQAIDYLVRSTTKPALILLDFQMPLMDGCQFLKAVRNDPWSSKIPVVAMTAAPGNPCAENIFILKKPFKSADLLNVVCRIIEASSPDPTTRSPGRN